MLVLCACFDFSFQFAELLICQILNNRVEPFMFADAIKLLTYTRCFLLFVFLVEKWGKITLNFFCLQHL